MKYGPREEVLYVVTVQPKLDEPHGDYLVTIDTDEKSSTYSTVIHRTFTNKTGNELHHSGWNACSSCHKVKKGTAIADIPKRDKLILPALHSNRVYVFDVGKDFRKPALYKEIDGSVMLAHGVSSPHTTHCLADGTILISTMGDANDEAKGDFIQFDSNYNCMGTWVRGDKRAQCGYDYWYQPYFDIMVATEWSAPKLFKRGWRNEDAKNLKEVGHHLNFYRWSDHTLIQTIDLGAEGTTPLEVRFLHDPKKAIGYVGCALNANVYRFYRSNDSDEEHYEVEKVIDIPTKLYRDTDSTERELGGMMGDILISLDDNWLYLTNWMHGDVRQYNITDTYPRLTAQLYLGGIANRPPGTSIIDREQGTLPNPTYIKGCRLEGAPQMLQLSLDGKRLYVSSSLYSPWDKQVNFIRYDNQCQ